MHGINAQSHCNYISWQRIVLSLSTHSLIDECTLNYTTLLIVHTRNLPRPQLIQHGNFCLIDYALNIDISSIAKVHILLNYSLILVLYIEALNLQRVPILLFLFWFHIWLTIFYKHSVFSFFYRVDISFHCINIPFIFLHCHSFPFIFISFHVFSLWLMHLIVEISWF